MKNFAYASKNTVNLLKALYSHVREDSSPGKIIDFLETLAKAGFGERDFYDDKWGWLLAAAVGELNIPQAVLKGEFRGWRVANGQIYTANEKLGIMTLCRNGKQVYMGGLARWWLDEEGNWYMEHRMPQGNQLICNGAEVYTGPCDRSRVSQGCMYVPMDVEFDRSERMTMSLFKFSPDGSKELAFQGQADEWRVSKGHVFTFLNESGKTVVHVDGEKSWEEKIGEYPLKVCNGWVFKLEPNFPSPSFNCFHGQVVFTPCSWEKTMRDMELIAWHPYWEYRVERLCVFAELRNRETHGLEIWRWPDYYTRMWTLPMADYRVDRTDLYVRVYQLDGQSVILKLTDP